MNLQTLVANIRQKKSFLCVGLDPDPAKMPQSLIEKHGVAEAIYRFNVAIIDATAQYAVAYKPNIAFYECHGAPGWDAFFRTVKYIRENYPDQFIIADAKRGDIGNTSSMYARTYFETADCDGVTVAPYMGHDSVGPFLQYPDRWVILLALTSNPGSADFQTQRLDNHLDLFEQVVATSMEWPESDRLMYVVGATRGVDIERVRRLAPEAFFLVPGVGAQGGSLEEVVKYGMTDNVGILVNSSRGIIHASRGEDFAEAAAKSAATLAGQMAAYL